MAADILGERCGVDLHIAPFELPYAGHTDAERRRLTEAVLRDLDGRGLAHRGRLETEVEDAVVLLGRAPVSASLVLAARNGRGQGVARIASNGRQALLVAQHGTVLRVDYVRPTAVVGALVGLVPDARPIRGRAVTFPRDDPAAGPAGRHRDPDEDNGGSLMRKARPANSAYVQERQLANAMAQQPRRRAGTVSVFSRDRHGREQQAAMLVWHDTDAGRYLIYHTASSDGVEWVSYAPADNVRVAQQLGQLWSEYALERY
ncbi:MAG TPA: ESX secretion-associated protein EspG [Pseudonocardiaceae bacterium]|nr:ESX secretion-associated protein EspG [Pseudonocardiaceae bacterium]